VRFGAGAYPENLAARIASTTCFGNFVDLAAMTLPFK
jgi:hypothetical protein